MMRPAARLASASAVAVAVAVVVVVAAAPASGGALDSRFAKERAHVDGQNQALAAKVKQMKPTRWYGLGGLKANAREAIDDKHGSVVIRQRTHVSRYQRANRALQILAAQLGDADMVPPGMTLVLERKFADLPKGQEIMVMDHAGKGFEDGDRASKSWRDAVSEETRLNGAVIDLLTQQRDRKLGNMLISKDGKLRLIDPDRTFKARTTNPSYRPQFFPGGGKIAYKSKQEKLGDLPAKAQELVRALASSSVSEIESFYGIKDVEAEVMRDRAKDIEKHGLTKAAEKFVRTLTLKPDR
jgi:hypothetical protein